MEKTAHQQRIGERNNTSIRSIMMRMMIKR